MMFARCSYADEAKIVVEKRLLRVHVLSEPQEYGAYDDKGNACNPRDEGCMSACTVERWTETDLFFDLESLTRVASVTESGKQGPGGKHKQSVTCSTDATGDVGVTGGGCNELLKTSVAGKAEKPGAGGAPADKDSFKKVAGTPCPNGWWDLGSTCQRVCEKASDCKEKDHTCSNSFGTEKSLCDFKKFVP